MFLTETKLTGGASPTVGSQIRQPQQVQLVMECQHVVETLQYLLLCRLRMHTVLGTLAVWMQEGNLWDRAYL